MEGEFAVTPRRCDLAQCMQLGATRKDGNMGIGSGRRYVRSSRRNLDAKRWRRGCIADEGKKGNNGKFSFSEGDELGNAHLQVARCDEAGPEDGHDVTGTALALADKLGTEPEALDEHRHHDELSDAGSGTPDSVKLFRNGFETDKRIIGVFVLHLRGVEGLYGGDGGNGTVDDGGCDSSLFTFTGEEEGREAL